MRPAAPQTGGDEWGVQPGETRNGGSPGQPKPGIRLGSGTTPEWPGRRFRVDLVSDVLVIRNGVPFGGIKEFEGLDGPDPKV